MKLYTYFQGPEASKLMLKFYEGQGTQMVELEEYVSLAFEMVKSKISKHLELLFLWSTKIFSVGTTFQKYPLVALVY